MARQLGRRARQAVPAKIVRRGADDAAELADAARRTIAFRLSGGGTIRPTNVSNSSNVGWSLAWNSALWARLGDGTQAHQTLSFLLQRAAFPNLFDGHPPGVFQIDGNLGIVGGMGEVLLQSRETESALVRQCVGALVEEKKSESSKRETNAGNQMSNLKCQMPVVH